MIEIISHRGFWLSAEEKNTEDALRRSFEAGFGTETDIRDNAGTLCISHDIPQGEPVTFRDFLRLSKEYKQDLPLLLNIKSDGIENLMLNALDEFSIKNYFAFDMSTPEMVKYTKRGDIRFLTRMSDVEPLPLLIEASEGIWVDDFFGKGLTPQDINPHIGDRHLLCFVSPELHGRPHLAFWKQLQDWYDNGAFTTHRIMLCTDQPLEARGFFKEGDKHAQN